MSNKLEEDIAKMAERALLDNEVPDDEEIWRMNLEYSLRQMHRAYRAERALREAETSGRQHHLESFEEYRARIDALLAQAAALVEEE